MSVIERAPAKTNLFLEVPRRRDDGFHELDTVFSELELADTLEVAARQDDQLVLHVGAGAPSGPDNLVWRAAEALRQDAKRPNLGAELTLTKAIPAGGGLGGGSSDAAAALRALDQVWRLETPPERLHALASALGSDVAFFLRGGLQRGLGRGEVLSPLPSPALPLHLALVFPAFGCPTPDVFRALRPHLPTEPRSPDALLAALGAGDLDAVAKTVFNRLEAPAFELFPALPRLRDALATRPGVLRVLLSGSGSTLVCLTTDAAAAGAIADDPGADLRAVATRTVA